MGPALRGQRQGPRLPLSLPADTGLRIHKPLVDREITGYIPEEHYADPDLGLKRVHPEDRHLLERSFRSPEQPLVLRWYCKDGVLI